jgi:TetR/AcrR family transcriptional regulator, transcriptional repressor of bet genes
MRRKDPDERRELILRAALQVAEADNFSNVTRETVANKAEVSLSLVTHYFGSMDLLRDEIMQAAIDEPVLIVVAQGLACRHSIALGAPEALKQKAARFLTR